jgi:probable rRNA maturation factor
LAVTVTTPDGGRVATRGLAAWLTRAAPARARGEVTVALVSDRRMQTLNRVFRGKDYATDVLSFPVDDSGGGSAAGGRRKPPSRIRPRIADNAAAGSVRSNEAGYLGDIVIAVGVARRQAAVAGHALGTELKVLALHGLLHLLGYDHEADTGLMSRTEARLRKNAGLKEGLIERLGPGRSGGLR